MGAILWYGLFCGVVILAVIIGILGGMPTNIVATLGVWTVSAGAILAVLYRYLARLR